MTKRKRDISCLLSGFELPDFRALSLVIISDLIPYILDLLINQLIKLVFHPLVHMHAVSSKSLKPISCFHSYKSVLFELGNIQDGTRNVIPLIVHVTHVYYYKKTFDIWYRINPHRLENCS